MRSSEKNDKNKSSLFAAIGTLVFHIVLLGLCFLFGLSVPLPLPEEQGVEVNVGNSETGLGTTTAAPLGQESPASSVSPAHTSTADYSTQTREETISLNSGKSNTQQKPTNQQQNKPDQPEQPQVNTNALFPNRRTGSETGGGQGTGQGITSGSGDQGKPGGDPNSNSYSGIPGKGGISFSLSGRSAKSLPKPQYTSNEQGNVVVKIWVNKDGIVTRSEAGERGTTIVDRSLWKMAEEAAKQSKFSPDNDAADIQIGTITYKFIRTN